MGVGILLLPLIIWLIAQSGMATILTVILSGLIGIKFLPIARTAWNKSSDMRDFLNGN